jgi:hypothetical protein
MIGPATGWFEMEQISNKTAAEVADICETTWFTRHPLPQQITLDRGTEFMAEFAKMVKNDYGPKLKTIVLEAVLVVDWITVNDLSDASFTSLPSSNRMLAATIFAVRATCHTTLQASPMQLAFGRDPILNIKHTSNWEHIRHRKQTRINENNKCENKSRRAHTCSLEDKMLVKARKNSKHELEYDGPYEITQVNDNETVPFQKRIVNHVMNIRRIKPFQKYQKTKFTTESNRPDHRGECSRPVLQ